MNSYKKILKVKDFKLEFNNIPDLHIPSSVTNAVRAFQTALEDERRTRPDTPSDVFAREVKGCAAAVHIYMELCLPLFAEKSYSTDSYNNAYAAKILFDQFLSEYGYLAYDQVKSQ